MGFLGTYLGTDLGTALGTNLAPRALSFSKASFFNASERYLLYGGLMTGPFAANVPATRVIGGRRYVQLEELNTTINTYSEQLADYYTGLDHATWSSNIGIDPLGDVTADKLCENSDISNHGAYYASAGDVANTLLYCGYAKILERSQFVARLDVSPVASSIKYDMVTGLSSVYTGATPDSYGLIPLSNGYYFWYMIIDHDGTGGASTWLRLMKDDILSYQGTAGEGALFWGVNVIATKHLVSYIKTEASSAIRTSDELSYAEADVPARLRLGFTQHIIFHEYSSAMLTTAGGQKVIASFDATAETVTVYLDGADNKVHVVGSVSGQFVESAALTWSLYQHAIVKFEFDNGSNSVLTTSGFTTGNGVVAGTKAEAADGDVTHGMNHTTFDEHFAGLLAQLEPL